jgi:hypothetical protein
MVLMYHCHKLLDLSHKELVPAGQAVSKEHYVGVLSRLARVSPRFQES